MFAMHCSVLRRHTFLWLLILFLPIGSCLLILLGLLAVQLADVLNLAFALVGGG